MKIKRQVSATFCEYCAEPYAMGNHAIPDDLAERVEKQKCVKCGSLVKAICMLGIGHFVYLCEKCENRWKNI